MSVPPIDPSSLAELPRDTIYEILLNLDPADLISQCESSYQFNRLCQQPVFLMNYFRRFGMDQAQIPGQTIRDKIQFLSEFNWAAVPGETLHDKGRFILDVIQNTNVPNAGQFILNIVHNANTGDLNTFTQEHYGGPEPQSYFLGQDYMINRTFRNVLGKAVQTGNPRFVQLVLDLLISRIGLQNLPNYLNSFRDPLVDVLAAARRPGSPVSPQIWTEIANIILRYYDPRQDPVIFRGDYASAIRQGDLPRVRGLAMIFPPDEEGFWMAVSNGRAQVASFLLNSLQRLGINPLQNLEAIEDEYNDAISDDNLSAVRILAQISPLTLTHLQLAEGAGAARVAAFIRQQLNI